MSCRVVIADNDPAALELMDRAARAGRDRDLLPLLHAAPQLADHLALAVLGAWLLFKTQLDILEAMTRGITDILWAGSARIRAWRGGDVRAETTNGGVNARLSGTTWRGRRAMRVSVCNWQTSEADVERVAREVEVVGVAAEERDAELGREHEPHVLEALVQNELNDSMRPTNNAPAAASG